jgi:hypothetical protein
MSSSNRKEVTTLIRIATKCGWIVIMTKSGHYKWTAPNGDFLFSSSTPSDWRGLERLKQDLRRRGLDVRKETEKKGKQK